MKIYRYLYITRSDCADMKMAATNDTKISYKENDGRCYLFYYDPQSTFATDGNKERQKSRAYCQVSENKSYI